jgi:hypothetical protein
MIGSAPRSSCEERVGDWWNPSEACSVLGICGDGTWNDAAVIGSAIPYLLAGAFAVGLILCEEWLQRRTGQSWWAVEQLGWGAFSTLLAALLVYFGHPLAALVAAALAVFEMSLARWSWVKRGSRDLLERNRLEVENPGATSRSGARGSRGLGVGGWIFVFGIVGVWSLLDHWGLSWVSAGVVAFVIAIVVFRLTRRRSSDDSVRWSGEGRWVAGDRVHVTRSVGRDHDQRADGVAAEREVHFTVTGRPARLLGRLLERLVHASDTSNE